MESRDRRWGGAPSTSRRASMATWTRRWRISVPAVSWSGSVRARATRNRRAISCARCAFSAAGPNTRGSRPSASRPVVQRRVSARRLPKWKRPDRDGGDRAWPGRWSLVNRAPSGDRHAPDEEDALAEVIARQWLDRYGVVARDWWRRERPPIAWRSIYRELRRMELRG